MFITLIKTIDKYIPSMRGYTHACSFVILQLSRWIDRIIILR